jgi:Resolvase, N terminal domain
MRTCTECGKSKQLDGFTSIRGTPYFHGRCKVCRAARARGYKPPPARKSQPPAGMRACKRCGDTKPLEEFVPVHGTRHRRACFVCRGVNLAPIAPLPPRRVFERTCVDCGDTKPIDAYVRIKATVNGFYGGCRDCRAKRSRERYHANPGVRANDIRRAQRNRALRRYRRGSSANETERPTTPTSDDSLGSTQADPPLQLDNQPLTTALVYLRVSTGEQERTGVGLAFQRASCVEYTRAHGWPIRKVYLDVMAGDRDGRPQYQAMLGDGDDRWTCASTPPGSRSLPLAFSSRTACISPPSRSGRREYQCRRRPTRARW